MEIRYKKILKSILKKCKCKQPITMHHCFIFMFIRTYVEELQFTTIRHELLKEKKIVSEIEAKLLNLNNDFMRVLDMVI
jgi:hypothetical protein